MAASTPAVNLPELFGHYRIVRPLGEGGMGIVYLAHDTMLGRDVALKVCRVSQHPQGLERFRREGKAAAQLRHPNLCPVYEYGEHDGIAYLTMACIQGPTLKSWLQDHSLNQSQAASLVAKLALAVQAAHDKGVIHRDLKPANIIMENDEPVIVDFGLAKLRDARTILTKLHSVYGTPSYMAPEQAGGDPALAGVGCDIYSLGVILYELLTGELPFSGRPEMVMAQVLAVLPKPLRERNASIDPGLEAVCLKALAKKPNDRFSSLKVFAAALTQAIQPIAPMNVLSLPPAPQRTQEFTPTAEAPASKTLPPPLPDLPQQESRAPSVTSRTSPGQTSAPGFINWKLASIIAFPCFLILGITLAMWVSIQPNAAQLQDDRGTNRISKPEPKPAVSESNWKYEINDRNPRLGLQFNNDMRFGLKMIGVPDPQDNSRVKRLSYFETGNSNNTIVKIGKDEYYFGRATVSSKWTGPRKGEKALPNIRAKLGIISEMEFASDKIIVTQHVEIVPGDSGLLDTCLVYYIVKNNSDVAKTIGLRLMLDTYIGANDGVPILIPGRKGFVTKSANLVTSEIPDYVEAIEDLTNPNNPGTVARADFKAIRLPGVDLEEIENLRICRWPGSKETGWEVPEDPIDGGPGQKPDSCIVLYWAHREMRPGEQRHLAFTYGLSYLQPSTDGRTTIALSMPSFVQPNREFVATAYVWNTPSESEIKLNLLDSGIRFIPGEMATKTIPQTGSNPQQVWWKLKSGGEGISRLEAAVDTKPQLKTEPRTIAVRSMSIFR